MNTKKIVRIVVSLVLAIVMCLPAVLPAYAATPGLSITGPATVKPGETFTVSVCVDNNPGIAGYTIRLNFDTSKLVLVDVQTGAKMSSRSITFNTDQGGAISNFKEVIAVYYGASNFTASGEFFTATFRVAAGASAGNATLTATMADNCNQNLEVVSFNPGSKTVKIASDETGSENIQKTIALKSGADKIKYIKGYADGTFKPNQAATRYEVVEALAKVFDINVASKPSGLVDVDPKYATQVNLFTAAGIIDGFPDKTFGGEQSITRAQFCKIIAVMLDLNIENPKNGGFKDVSGWAKVYIDACAEAGLVKGKDEAKKLFDPSANITRAELATLVNRITGAGDSGTSCKYPDVKPGTWYFGWVAAAAE